MAIVLPALPEILFAHGDRIVLTRWDSKAYEADQKLKMLHAHEPLTVVGTRIIKRFPALYDHQNNDYIQKLTVDVEGQMHEISGGHCALANEQQPTSVRLLKTTREGKDPETYYCVLTETFADTLDVVDPWRTLGQEIDAGNPGVKQSFINTYDEAVAWCKANRCVVVQPMWEAEGY